MTETTPAMAAASGAAPQHEPWKRVAYQPADLVTGGWIATVLGIIGLGVGTLVWRAALTNSFGPDDDGLLLGAVISGIGGVVLLVGIACFGIGIAKHMDAVHGVLGDAPKPGAQDTSGGVPPRHLAND